MPQWIGRGLPWAGDAARPLHLRSLPGARRSTPPPRPRPSPIAPVRSSFSGLQAVRRARQAHGLALCPGRALQRRGADEGGPGVQACECSPLDPPLPSGLGVDRQREPHAGAALTDANVEPRVRARCRRPSLCLVEGVSVPG